MQEDKQSIGSSDQPVIEAKKPYAAPTLSQLPFGKTAVPTSSSSSTRIS